LSHDGYARDFGLIHERELTLTADGAALLGVDRLVAAEGGGRHRDSGDFALRFHLHPRVRVTLCLDGAVELNLANGEILDFEAQGVSLEVEDSIFFAAPGGARKCAQIVLRGAAAAGVEIAWSFRRRAGAPVPPGRQV
jgi:uncharacterized heparinase superfamily protein